MNRFIGSSPVVITNNYYTVADVHSLQSLHTNLLATLPFPCSFSSPLKSSKSKSKSLYDWQFTANQFVLASSLLRPTTRYWHENVFKIVAVQVPTKLEMWQNYVAFVFVITYVLQVMWPCVVHILITDHRPLLSMRVPRVCALTSSSGRRGKWGLDLRSGRTKN
jgi:hypothetical protein